MLTYALPVRFDFTLRANWMKPQRQALQYRLAVLSSSVFRKGRAAMPAGPFRSPDAERMRSHAHRSGHPQRTSAPSGRVHRRPPAGAGGRRIGQDARFDLPHRASHRRHARGAVGDPGDHVHQQGGSRDARAPRRAGGSAFARHVGVDVPQHVRAHPARRRRAHGLHPQLHDLRHRRPEAPVQGDHVRAGHRSTSVSRSTRS